MSRKKTKAFWGPTALPKLARAQARDSAAAAAKWQGYLDGGGALPESVRERIPDHIQDAAESAHGWEMADLFWVTHEMAQVALDASTDMPGFIPSAEAPCPVGAIFFQRSLPRIKAHEPLFAADWTEITGGPVDGLRWRRRGDRFIIEVLCRTENFGPHPLAPDAPFQELFSIQIPSASVVLDEIQGPGLLEDPAHVAVVALLGTTWHMMQQPTVATPQPRDGATGAPRGPRLPSEPAGAVVTTVDLRVLKHIVEERPEKGEDGRVYRHRWVVRGHWKNQAHGRGRAERKLIWVPSHIKGPEGAPLLASEKVMVWRR